tara:strand:- start:567 stop:1319 length:753 start_codon:yes stop_codon:yes gene_type:complete
MRKKYINKIIIIFFITSLINSSVTAEETYFDLSEKEIQIQTDFNGKEIIIFGILKKNQDTIVSIKGPDQDTKVRKKERILGFWFNTKKVIYKKLPTLFFLASSDSIKNILNQETIIKEKLYFDELLVNAITQRDFIDQNNLKIWNKNLIDIKFSENLYKEYKFENVNNKLFQTRVFFPSNSSPGKYIVTVFQVKDKIIQNKQNRVINIKKAGVGEKIFKFANEKPASYGLLTIFFAIISGILAATVFRRI